MDKTEFSTAVLSFNFDETEWSDDEFFGNALDLVTVYGLYEMGRFENQDSEINKHGWVINASLPISFFTNETGPESITTSSLGINIGAGYGFELNDFAGYGTINNGLFSIFNSNATGFDGPETSFLPSNSAFLRFATMWTPFGPIKTNTKTGATSKIGFHAALNVSLVEGGGSAFLLGVAINPF